MDKDFIRRIEDLQTRCRNKNQLTCTQFLDPAQLAAALLQLKSAPADSYLASGGYECAERQRLFFLPDYMEPSYFPLQDYLISYRIDAPFGALTHRDYLGSLMGLGITREAIGDILVFDGYGYIVCTEKIAPFLESNLKKIGRFGAKLTRIGLGELQKPEEVYETVTTTVPSLRADSLSAAAFGLSRTTAAQQIRQGMLSINHLEVLEPSAAVEEGDLLSLRGHGRGRIYQVGGASKKGRTFVTIHVLRKKS